MSITIKNINIKNLGPLRDVSFDLSKFNVFYSPNEGGKTLLTEFLLTSIFKNKQAFKNNLREVSADGKVILEGLEKEETSFTFKNKKYIEDFLTDYSLHFSDISRLAVVRAAEVMIDKNKEGEIDVDIVRRLLSKAEIFSKIKDDKNIPKAVQAVTLKGSEVVFDINQGKIKELKELDTKLKNTETLIKEVEESYGGGERALIDIEIKKLEAQKENQLLAKKHFAYLLSEKIKELKEKADMMAEEDLDELSEKVNQYFYHIQELENTKEETYNYKKRADNYKWLKEVKDLYYKYSKEEKVETKNINPIAPFLSLIFLGVAIFFDYALLSYLFFITTTILFSYYFYKKKDKKGERTINSRYNDLKDDFYKKNKTNLTEAVLLEKYKDAEYNYNNYQNTKEKIVQKENSIKLLKKDIDDLFLSLIGKNIKEKKWKDELKNTKNNKKKILKEIESKERQLSNLRVEEKNYIAEKTDEDYDENKLLSIERKTEEKRKEEEEITSKLNNLKQKICNITDDKMTDEWSVVIDNINNKLIELQREVEEKKAEIIAKKLVFESVEELEKKENKKIEERLSSNYIKDLIIQFTDNSYQNIYLQDNKIFLSSFSQEFPLGDLSTGTKEQVMLALRLGFLKEIMKGRDMFLLLDDAFQHSDWKRREKVIETLAKISLAGHQILYFTMDDHILELFDKYGKELKGNYRRFALK